MPRGIRVLEFVTALRTMTTPYLPTMKIPRAYAFWTATLTGMPRGIA